MYLVFTYKNRRMKPTEIVPRRRVGGKRGKDGENKSNIHCKHICKYHNISTLQLLYAKRGFLKTNI
jgi:hypothetical protein